MCSEIGANEAQARFPELLHGVMGGKRYTITLRGKAVAELVPIEFVNRADVALAVEQMQQFMLAHRSGSAVDLKSLISDGRP